MVIIKLDTKKIGCQKPGCRRRLEIPHRHHRRFETIFISAFSRNRRNKSESYKALRDRYALFREEDTVQICGWHHAEIHVIYKDVIAEDMRKRLKPLDRYSWKQANALMDKLRQTCLDWEQEKTPGVNPAEVFKQGPMPRATYV